MTALENQLAAALREVYHNVKQDSPDMWERAEDALDEYDRQKELEKPKAPY